MPRLDEPHFLTKYMDFADVIFIAYHSTKSWRTSWAYEKILVILENSSSELW